MNIFGQFTQRFLNTFADYTMLNQIGQRVTSVEELIASNEHDRQVIRQMASAFDATKTAFDESTYSMDNSFVDATTYDIYKGTAREKCCSAWATLIDSNLYISFGY